MHSTKPIKKTKIKRIEKGVLIPADLPSYAIPFLLSAYKFGLFVVRNVFNIKKWDDLVKAGYIEYVRGYDEKNIMVSLTERGATFVRKYALALLVNYSPYYTYPIIRSGDKVDITTDVLGFAHRGVVQLVDNLKGIHIIHSIDRNSIFMSHENLVSKNIRITMKPSKDYIKFATDVNYTQKEFNQRLGKIVLRTILDKTDGLFNGILVADQLDKMYNKSYVKNRIKKT